MAGARRGLAIVVCGLFALLLAAPAGHAQTTPSMLSEPWPDKTFYQSLDHILVMPTGHVQGVTDGNGGDIHTHGLFWDSTGRLRFATHDTQGLVPIIGYRDFTEDIGTRSHVLPNHLNEYSLAVGANFQHFDLGRFGHDYTVGVLLGAGYSGNTTFGDASGIFGIGHLVATRNLGDNQRNQVSVSLDYYGNGAFLQDIPLPGFSYAHHGEKLDVLVGFPQDTIGYKITDKLIASANYLVPYTVDAQLNYNITDNFTVFGDFANFFQGFALDGQRREDRVFQQMRRVEAGLRFHNEKFLFGLGVDAAITGGYAFDQQFSRGFDVRDSHNIAEISPEPFVGFVIRGSL